MDFEVRDVTTTTNLMVVNAFGTQNVKFKYIFFRGTGVTFNEFEEGISTLVGQANAESRDCRRCRAIPQYSTIWTCGPYTRFVLARGGTLIDGISRNKPDICAPNGVNTTVDLGGVGAQIDGDEFPNFSGTSAAAPHVAGALALIKEARQKFLNQGTSPQEAKDLLTSTALDMGTPGYDISSGAGFIQPHLTLLTFANPKPELLGFTIPDDVDLTTIGSIPFELILQGNFLTDSTKVMLVIRNSKRRSWEIQWSWR